MIKNISNILDKSLKKYSVKIGLTIFAFFSGYFIVGPVIHEVSHLVLIEFSRCSYLFKPDFNTFTGFRSAYEIQCSVESWKTIFFYFSGYFGTLIGSLPFLYLSNKLESIYSNFSLVIALGMLISVVSSITLKGDVYNGMGALGAAHLSGFTEIVLTLLVFTITLISLEFYFQSGSSRMEGMEPE